MKKSRKVALLITGAVVLAACQRHAPVPPGGVGPGASPTPTPPFWSYRRWFGGGGYFSGGSHFYGSSSGSSSSGSGSGSSTSRGGFGSHGGGGGE